MTMAYAEDAPPPSLLTIFWAALALARHWWSPRPWRVSIEERHDRKGFPPLLYTAAARREGGDACFVDGSARNGRCGFGAFYSDGHRLNRSAAVDVTSPFGANNVAELAAIFSTVLRHPRAAPLRVFTDSALSLRALGRARNDPDAHLPLPPPGPALARATVALLELRTAETTLAKVAGHGDVPGNQIADALAAAGAARRADVLALPAAFYGGGRATLSTLRLQVAYLARESNPPD